MNHSNKTHIGGIKFSEERAHFTIHCPHSKKTNIDALLQLISDKQINIPFLCHAAEPTSTRTSFCVSAKDAPLLSEIITCTTIEKGEIISHYQVGSITIFPHKNNFRLIAIIMSLMESLQLPVYSFATSISALIFNTQYGQLCNIAKQLTEIFELPENHAPFHPEFQLRQPRTSMTQ